MPVVARFHEVAECWPWHKTGWIELAPRIRERRLLMLL
jgi:hypothetical protein